MEPTTAIRERSTLNCSREKALAGPRWVPQPNPALQPVGTWAARATVAIGLPLCGSISSRPPAFGQARSPCPAMALVVLTFGAGVEVGRIGVAPFALAVA